MGRTVAGTGRCNRLIPLQFQVNPWSATGYAPCVCPRESTSWVYLKFDWYDLVAAARDSLPSAPGRPREATLRRALSTGYYALFHCLAATAADLLVGGPGANRSESAWRQAYRAIDHAQVRERCRRSGEINKFPKEIRKFAETFVDIQMKRHKADYDPDGQYFKSSITRNIVEVEAAISAFESAPARDRRAFAVYVSMRIRP